VSQPTLFDDDVADGPVDDAARIRTRVCHPSGTPRRSGPPLYLAPEMTTLKIRDAIQRLDHVDLVALIMSLCTGTYPRIARDSVIAELVRRGLVSPGEAPGGAV